MQGNDKRNQAIAQFEKGDYRNAFLSFTELYENSGDVREREIIFQILEDGYYQPNKDDLKKRYEENCCLLSNYPFQLGFRRCPYENLPVKLFQVSETEYCLFHKEEKTFSELQIITSDELKDYLFKDLSRPVFRENDCNLYHIQYLQDNVRRSEDFGGDNHIYLYFDGLSELAPLLLLGELSSVLEDQKFVFLIGRKNRKKYPLDFKRQFQIDYAAMGAQPVRIEEIKRICFWYKHAHSGTGLSRAVLGSLPEIQMLSGHDFNVYSQLDGKVLYFTEEFRSVVSDVSRAFTVNQIRDMVQSGRYDLRLKNLEEYLDWLEQRRPAPHTYTVKELFCGYFLFWYERRGLNPRVAPMLLYDPHMWDPSPYSNIILSFPYYTVLTCIREPIMTFIRCQQIGIVGWDEFSTKYMLAFDYAHAQFLHHDLLSCYYGFRFEDLKTKPEVVCPVLCKHLNVPYNKIMLETDEPAKSTWHEAQGISIRGFDQTPLHWDLSGFLSEFDMARLKMFYEPIHRYYGYPTFSFQECPLPEELVRKLFSYPFRFEYMNTQIYSNAPPQEDFHTWIQEILQNYWRKRFVSPKLIPLEMPEEA